MSEADILTRFDHEVRTAVEAANLTDNRLLLAVSGGSDSLSMLYSLHRLQNEMGLTLHAAHLDHGLRGSDSASDADFVAKTCAKLGIDCTVQTEDVSVFRRARRLSPEEAAREIRYRFLAHVAERVGTDTVATGHTLDDRIETVLMNIIKGSGLRGLRGIRAVSVRQIEGITKTLFRPLLNLSKGDTNSYCKTLALVPRFDESNHSTKFMRNKIRLEVLPLLREINPALDHALLRLSKNAADSLAVVENAVTTAWSEIVIQERRLIRIDRERFSELDPALRSHLILRALAHVKGETSGVERVHVRDTVRAVLYSPGAQLHLPCGIRLRVEQRAALLYIPDSPPSEKTSSRSDAFPLAVPGTTVVGNWRITTERIKTPPPKLPPQDGARFIERFGRGLDESSLAVRGRRPGDRFQPLGMTGTKKLKDFMIDEKIPGSMRDRVPLIVTSSGIAWAVGWRIAEWAKVDESDSECMEIRLEWDE